MSSEIEPCIDMPRNSTAPAEERYDHTPCASSAIFLTTLHWRPCVPPLLDGVLSHV